jgi:CRISPR-associated protein Cmr2
MNYIAYTIGPIYETIFKTLNDDHKTKRLKAGSEFFSCFMRELLGRLREDVEVLVPYVGDEVFLREYRMGLFHDRFIARSAKECSELQRLFARHLADTLEALAEKISSACSAKELAENMDNHLLVATEDELRSIDENVIFALNRALDSMELQRSFSPQNPQCITRYQENRIKSERVRSLEVISGEMNYYAVITADGDRMGERIREQATQRPEEIVTLSRSLYDFFTQGDDLYALTHDTFGGELIYAGGDDILALLPVKKNGRDFLSYIEMLDRRFKAHVGEEVSLSFGVNIVYYKYPLRDAINGAFSLLKYAKQEGANTMALKVTKHSGQRMQTALPISDTRYERYSRMLGRLIDEKGMALPHAFHHSLRRYKDAIISLFAKESAASLEALFETVYNDERSPKVKAGLEEVRDYITLCAPDTSEAFERLFSELSIIKFLREDRR